MDYIGKKVFHKMKYGKGIVKEQDEKGRIYVKFDTEPDMKSFVAPDCFQNYLQLLDKKVETAAAKDYEKKQQEVEKQILKTRRDAQFAQRINKKRNRERNEKVYDIPKSIAGFQTDQEKLLNEEIEYLREDKGKRLKLLDGKLVEIRNGYYIYSFETETELNLPDQTQVEIWTNSSVNGVPGIIVNCEEFTVIMSVSSNIGHEVSVVEITLESWKLLQSLIDRLKSACVNPSKIVENLILHGRSQILEDRDLTKGQIRADRMSRTQPITFVWGPPGTGKTETLANIALSHMNEGERVLMLSYSNVSVDGAALRVFGKAQEKQPGLIVRYGYPRNIDILRHEYLGSYNLTLRNHPDLLNERKKLLEERKTVKRDSEQYVIISRALAKIKSVLDDEEKKAVKKAAFVATTVSKAVADKTIYEDKYDTVIFDEASMAYIAQIVFSASLAKKHFVCMGDFSQLPPIVQSTKASMLSTDIFQYCGIVEAVEEGCGHDWLCMLNTQYRMHPDIADFASRTMYHGLLESALEMEKSRKTIVESEPFKGNALHLVDLSGMMSVCSKNGDQSRINVLSAIISMGLATSFAKTLEVGVITPYNAQSRLLNAMARDIAEQNPERKKISCATVHQFQGSEQDVIVYDATDCYRMQYPGILLTSMENNYANRLYNVAVTRAKGKFIAVANVDYLMRKNLSKKLIFREMLDERKDEEKSHGIEIFKTIKNSALRYYEKSQNGGKAFLKDLEDSKKEINIDIPEGVNAKKEWIETLVAILTKAKESELKVIIRTNDKSKLPPILREVAIENKYVMNPIAVIDKKIVWYGMPISKAEFVTDDGNIKTLYRPVFRFVGDHFAQALYGFLDMNHIADMEDPQIIVDEDGSYATLAAYVAKEVFCPECRGKTMRLKKSSRGKVFLQCENYSKCRTSEYITVDIVNDYLQRRTKGGARCPVDNTLLEARLSKYGVYVCCGGYGRHTFKLDEI